MQNTARYSTANQIQEQMKPKRNKSGTEMKLSKRRNNHKHIEHSRKNHVNNLNAKENTTSGQYDVSTVKNSSNSKLTIIENEMNSENLYHWGASRKVLEVIRRRNKSPETRRLLEIKETLARPVTMGRRYDP